MIHLINYALRESKGEKLSERKDYFTTACGQVLEIEITYKDYDTSDIFTSIPADVTCPECKGVLPDYEKRAFVKDRRSQARKLFESIDRHMHMVRYMAIDMEEKALATKKAHSFLLARINELKRLMNIEVEEEE